MLMKVMQIFTSVFVVLVIGLFLNMVSLTTQKIYDIIKLH